MGDAPTQLARRLENDQTAALRAGDKLRLGVIRRARAAIKNAEIAAREPLADDAVQRVLQGLVKQHRESIEQFADAGRGDRADAERDEMAILEEYLPASVDPAEIDVVVAAVADELRASGPKDMGAVMKTALARLGAGADGKIVSAAAKRVLDQRSGG